MRSGRHAGRKLSLVRDTVEAVGLCQAGKLSEGDASMQKNRSAGSANSPAASPQPTPTHGETKAPTACTSSSRNHAAATSGSVRRFTGGR